MNAIIEKLKEHLLQQPVNYGYDDADSLLQMLYYYYTVANPISSDAIRRKYEAVINHIDRLSVQQSDSIFDLICELCLEHERCAFIEGIHVGVRLTTELTPENLFKNGHATVL